MQILDSFDVNVSDIVTIWKSTKKEYTINQYFIIFCSQKYNFSAYFNMFHEILFLENILVLDWTFW